LRCFAVLLDGSPGSAVGVLGFFYNVLLASLTLVFTASNAFFFLVAWEVMALSAYCLVGLEHEKEETRKAGILFLVMSHSSSTLCETKCRR
jgi:hydrogenase-4 component B